MITELMHDTVVAAPRHAVAAAHPPTAFALTDLQQAYWIGEQPIYRLHAHAFLSRSFACSTLDLARLARALCSVVKAYPALHTRVLNDGTQCVAPPPAQIDIPVYTHAAPFDRDTTDTHLRTRLPAFDAGLVLCALAEQLPDGWRVHIAVRLIAVDGHSLGLFFEALAQAYAYDGHYPTPAGLAPFSAYIDSLHALRQTAAYRDAKSYWETRLDTLPPAPDLPTVPTEQIPMHAHFTRMQHRLSPETFERLKRIAAACGISINALLCTAYTDVLRLWSRHKAFTLNVLLAIRPPEFEGTLGNFSTTLLLEVANTPGTLRDRGMALQRQLYRDIGNSAFSGIEVIRAMHHSGQSSPAMPVVFASTLGATMHDSSANTAALGWQVSGGSLHTPQVMLDHQLYMEGGWLVLNWDVVMPAFEAGIPEAMFATYGDYLQRIALASKDNLQLRPTLSADQLQARMAANQTAAPLPIGLLHDGYVAACRKHADRIALADDEREISYAQLWRYTSQLAAKLRQAGAGRNTLVAIMARKGWRQYAAMMAVLQAGAAYLPVMHSLPVARREYLLARPGVQVVLADADALAEVTLPQGVAGWLLQDALPDQAPDAASELIDIGQQASDLAYVIFTSGSTGQPKGVMIDHQGARNTVLDIIARFGLDADDKVIALSAFNFDLSVYDLAATLGVGATLVIPGAESTPSPDRWAEKVRRYGVTVWNSVPALLDMQLEYLGDTAADTLKTLRLVMLSGDWIPLSLPRRLFDAVPAATLISMGGATEASIWSNYFVVPKQLDPSWKSIPYGYPLSNQQFHVLDADLQHVPTGVAGNLFIGGKGLALGYYGDADKTAASFIRHPETGERLYRTGDLGCYHADGSIEFLGREDTQVKIRGYRIELGEIESAVQRFPGVVNAAAIVRGDTAAEKQIVVFFATSTDASVEVPAVQQYLRALLPEYMLPAGMERLDTMPVTDNGKINRKALLTLAVTTQAQRATEAVAPRNADEQALSILWTTLLARSVEHVHANFFDLGGTSLLAVRLLNAIKERFQIELPLASLFEHDTVAKQAALIHQSTQRCAGMRPLLVPIRSYAAAQTLVLIHPVGGNVLCYRPLVDLLPEDHAIVAMQSPGDGLPRSIDALARRYAETLHQALPESVTPTLLGWSFGGVVGHEVAVHLGRLGRRVERLITLDSWIGDEDAPLLDDDALFTAFTVDISLGRVAKVDALHAMADGATLPLAERMQQWLATNRETGISADDLARLFAEYRANYLALQRHTASVGGVATYQYEAARVNTLPGLNRFRVPEAALCKTVEEDHFSIMQRSALMHILSESVAR